MKWGKEGEMRRMGRRVGKTTTTTKKNSEKEQEPTGWARTLFRLHPLCVTHTSQVVLNVCLQLQVSSGCVSAGEHVLSSTGSAFHCISVPADLLPPCRHHQSDNQSERRGRKRNASTNMFCNTLPALSYPSLCCLCLDGKHESNHWSKRCKHDLNEKYNCFISVSSHSLIQIIWMQLCQSPQWLHVYKNDCFYKRLWKNTLNSGAHCITALYWDKMALYRKSSYNIYKQLNSREKTVTGILTKWRGFRSF